MWTVWMIISRIQITSYLENVADVEVCELLLHVDASLIVGIDKGERTTDPGVIVGSSSIDFNWLP